MLFMFYWVRAHDLLSVLSLPVSGVVLLCHQSDTDLDSGSIRVLPACSTHVGPIIIFAMPMFTDAITRAFDAALCRLHGNDDDAAALLRCMRADLERALALINELQTAVND